MGFIFVRIEQFWPYCFPFLVKSSDELKYKFDVVDAVSQVISHKLVVHDVCSVGTSEVGVVFWC